VGPREGEDLIAHYLQVLTDKTGSLISLAAVSGVVFGRAPDAFEEPMRLFGERVGVAFQLADDVIDLAPAAAGTGKSAGTDLRAGVPTMPLLLLRQRADGDAAAAALLERVAEDADAAIPALREHQVTRDTLAEARRWAASAVEALAPLPDGAVRTALTRFAEAVVDRSR